MTGNVLLEINDLAVEFFSHRRKIHAVRGLDLTVLPGQFHAPMDLSGPPGEGERDHHGCGSR